MKNAKPSICFASERIKDGAIMTDSFRISKRKHTEYVKTLPDPKKFKTIKVLLTTKVIKPLSPIKKQ